MVAVCNPSPRVTVPVDVQLVVGVAFHVEVHALEESEVFGQYLSLAKRVDVVGFEDYVEKVHQRGDWASKKVEENLCVTKPSLRSLAPVKNKNTKTQKTNSTRTGLCVSRAPSISRGYSRAGK